MLCLVLSLSMLFLFSLHKLCVGLFITLVFNTTVVIVVYVRVAIISVGLSQDDLISVFLLLQLASLYISL